jgi:diadenylate cyclase
VKQLDFFKILLSLKLIDLVRVAVDITVVAFVLYRLIILIRGTRAVQLIKGLVVLFAASFLAKILKLSTIDWILEQVRLALVVALPIVFQPELRRALEQLGRGKFFARPLAFLGEEDMSRLISELVRGIQILVKLKYGALIVIERETGVSDYIETGVSLDSVVSAELLINIFVPNTPLHDGAAVIRGDRIAAAGCFLPLSENPYLNKQLGTRHRAALGISENSDAIAIVVSEETGTVSLAQDGKLVRFLDEKKLREMLEDSFVSKTGSQQTYFWQKRW